MAENEAPDHSGERQGERNPSEIFRVLERRHCGANLPRHES